MFLLHESSPERIRRFMREQERSPLSYREVGASRGTVTPPPGYARNHARIRLGEGEAAYRRAVGKGSR